MEIKQKRTDWKKTFWLTPYGTLRVWGIEQNSELAKALKKLAIWGDFDSRDYTNETVSFEISVENEKALISLGLEKI